jgi:serine protease Do
LTPLALAQESYSRVLEEANRKVVKLFGPGGFHGLEGYGTGVLVSGEGHILTVASPLLLTQDLRVHLWDGRRFSARVLASEPEFDAALLKIDKADDLEYFDIAKAARAPLAKPGQGILAFTNQFKIATGDEPISILHGVVAAYSKLHGRRGIFDAPYTGDVYVIDAITNNPGAAGGAMTTRKGELLGLIGRELRNTLTDTWINYAVPIQVLAGFVEKAKTGKYQPIAKAPSAAQERGFTGIVLVPNVVERTPPFVEDVIPGSPAAQAGLKPDDLIVYVDGQQVASIKAFRDFMERARPGMVVKLEVRRLDKEVDSGERLVTIELKIDKPAARPPKK